jgi:hypothetical protein
VPENAYIQYGCFGLLAVLVVWCLLKGIPSLLDKHEKVVTYIATEHKAAAAKMTEDHKAAIQLLTAEFAEESRLCREERIELSRTTSADRSADREARHELAEKLNQIALNMRVSQLHPQSAAAQPPTQTR